MRIWLTILLFPILCHAQRIEAENYSVMRGIQIEDCAEGGKNIAFIDKDDFLEYTVPSGTYKINFRLASMYSGEQFQIRQSNDAVIYTVQVPNTGGWQTWKTVTTTLVTIPGKIRIYSNTTGWNINWLELVPTNTPPVISLGTDTTVYFPGTITLSASVKDDDAVKTVWSFDGVGQGEIKFTDSLLTPAWFIPGVVNVNMIAIDSKGLSTKATKKITVLYDPNREHARYPFFGNVLVIVYCNGDMRTVTQ